MKNEQEKLMRKAHELLEETPEKEKIEHEKQALLKNDSCKEELSRTKESLIRLQAEFDNFRKRTYKEKEDLAKNASAQTLKGLLDIADEFELALAGMDKHEHRKGIEMLYGNLVSFLKREGVEPMPHKETFDPYLHECLKREAGPDGKIISVLKKGYTYKGNVLRHALVIVGDGKGGS